MLKPFDLRSSDAHAKLLSLAQDVGQMHMLQLFETDAERLQNMHLEVGPMYMDWSKHRVNESVMEALFELAEEADWQGGIRQLFGGAPINQTESPRPCAVRRMILSTFKVPL